MTEREDVLEERDRQLTVLLREMVSAVAESGIEPLPFLRETCEKALAALATPAPAVSTDEIVEALEDAHRRLRIFQSEAACSFIPAILSRLKGEL